MDDSGAEVPGACGSGDGGWAEGGGLSEKGRATSSKGWAGETEQNKNLFFKNSYRELEYVNQSQVEFCG